MSSTSDTSTYPRPQFPEAIIRVLRCPLCARQLKQEEERLHCVASHSFDRAKQGYVTLRTGDRTPQNADTPAMVAARDTLLDTSLYGHIRTRAAELVAAEVTAERTQIVADLAGGTGYYLAGILDGLPSSLGICVDLSAAALRRAARCHPRAVAVGADLNRTFPLADASISVVTSFFGPRNVPEIRRVMHQDSLLLVVSPTARHLTELIEPLGMIGVDHRKEERLRTTLSSFAPIREERVEYQEPLTGQQLRAIVGMGPSAHHIPPAVMDSRIGRLPSSVTTTISVNLRLYGRDKYGAR